MEKKAKQGEELEGSPAKGDPREIQGRKKRKEILLCSGHNERGVVAGSTVLA